MNEGRQAQDVDLPDHLSAHSVTAIALQTLVAIVGREKGTVSAAL